MLLEISNDMTNWCHIKKIREGINEDKTKFITIKNLSMANIISHFCLAKVYNIV